MTNDLASGLINDEHGRLFAITQCRFEVPLTHLSAEVTTDSGIKVLAINVPLVDSHVDKVLGCNPSNVTSCVVGTCRTVLLDTRVNALLCHHGLLILSDVGATQTCSAIQDLDLLGFCIQIFCNVLDVEVVFQ